MIVHRRSCFLLVLSYELLMVLMLEPGAARVHAQNPGETGLTASQVVARLMHDCGRKLQGAGLERV